MKFRMALESGYISEKMSVKAMAKAVVREMVGLNDDNVILVYIVKEDTNILNNNVLSVYLRDNEISVWDEGGHEIATYSFKKVPAYVFYKDMVSFLAAALRQYEQLVGAWRDYCIILYREIHLLKL